MKLKEASNRCDICLERPIDPTREDDLCAECGLIADKYAESDENMIELDDKDCGCLPDEDCGCR